jgi:hypothetical protein
MNKKKKTWREKLADNRGFPKVCRIDETKSKRWGDGNAQQAVDLVAYNNKVEV